MSRYAPLVTPMLAPSFSSPPMVMVLLPARNTLLAALSLVFPVTVGAPDTVKVAFSWTNTPLFLLPVMLPPLMVKVPTDAYTPPPFVAVLLLTLVASPFMVM